MKKRITKRDFEPKIKYTSYEPSQKLQELMGVPSDEEWEKKKKREKERKKILKRPIAPKKGRRLTRLGKPMRVSVSRGVAGLWETV